MRENVKLDICAQPFRQVHLSLPCAGTSTRQDYAGLRDNVKLDICAQPFWQVHLSLPCAGTSTRQDYAGPTSLCMHVDLGMSSS